MLRAYMQDDITVLYHEGETWGEPDATTDVDMKAYVVWDTHLIMNIAGEKVIGSPLTSRAIVYVMPARVITHADKIKIDGKEYVVIDIRPGKDFSGNHTEVHIQ